MKTVISNVYTSDLINILTKFHKDWMKTNPKPDFIKINILTKFHQDWMQTVTSTVYTNKLLTDGRTDTRRHAQRTPDITRSHKLTVSLHDSCSSSHCVNTFFVTVNGGGGGGGGGGGCNSGTS
ncbi:hypothetical protein DPMN_028264 [Dreissena polymorpha]|uniref:Uncharacterized protein n=1 Tax=Dreissena polymorpha TaxID=45954 RepID=A0A9D4LW04_DREPO|nr:hypothetical protein DPMN_028264 [Dreissena polymorpha]